MTAREEFLSRVRSALGRRGEAAGAADTPPPVADRVLRLETPGPGLAGTFAARATGTGMVVHRCTPVTLSDALSLILKSIGATSLALDELEPSVFETVCHTIAEQGSRIVRPCDCRSLDPQFDCDVGITGVHAAIAETGTLVIVSDTRRSRGTFMLPPVHVAIVRESQIVPDMLDLWRMFDRPPPTAITLISGPSKTADIEGILVTGVHGPRSVHVAVMSDG